MQIRDVGYPLMYHKSASSTLLRNKFNSSAMKKGCVEDEEQE